ncbi:undecaprenyl-diphosphate phosphatase [Thermovirga lienii]|uniref:undecaprenyl-diphosphate phosphatase n=1 Tax=Thermovirga lienii TaxID=336261 RepID=UPI002FE24A41
MIKSVLLGALQGFTEFLPVSSSGHLVLAQSLLGFAEHPLPFDILLHIATMLATVCFFYKSIWEALKGWLWGFTRRDLRDSWGWKTGWAVIVGNVATVFVALLMKDKVAYMFQSPTFVGIALIITGLVLWYGSGKKGTRIKPDLKSGFLCGLAQGIAVIPGISRSGITIVTALVRGFSLEEAFRFSFMLSLPAIGGAVILEILDAGAIDAFASNLPKGWIWGVLSAFLCGMFALAILRRVVIFGKWRYFSVYCFVVGVLSLFVGMKGV